MCGRFTLRTPAADLIEIFEVARSFDLTPRYNIAPTQQVAAVREVQGARELVPLRWGLLPAWSDAAGGPPMINARSETAADRPAFRNAFRSRRCLIPADGFYEWRKTGGDAKQPYLITLRDELPFAFAGLWERCRGPDEKVVESCTILTTDANDRLRELHDRMPVILPPDHYGPWLDPRVEETAALQSLLTAYPSSEMSFRPVSRRVNNARNDDPSCIAPPETQHTLL
ncbi:MAG TPA: SOS response-associated peptidase [Planctomycetaceae bacterium]|jgi:putative SOS response-associated peptidase YedK|nr:SOS response-associated peptidase [Planctomycetaceae bacterium]